MANVVSDVRSWFEEPIVGQVDPVHLFLLTGIVIVSVVLWNLILMHVRLAAEEIV